MARKLEEISSAYTQVCIDLGEAYYKRGVLEKNITEYTKKADELQAEAQLVLDADKAAKEAANALQAEKEIANAEQQPSGAV